MEQATARDALVEGRHLPCPSVRWISGRAGRFASACVRRAAREYWVRGTYREIVAPERIVFNCALENEKRNHEALFTVTFLERKGRTSLTLRSVLLDAAQARKGAEGG